MALSMVINGDFYGIESKPMGYNQDLYATKVMAIWGYHWDINVQ